MTDDPTPHLSSLVRDRIARPSPIRQIMKMAERKNIVGMGLDPEEVISFGGGWVDHPAPEGFREAYREVASDPELFHRSGAYSATLGSMECREQIARFEEELFGVTNLGPEHVAVGAGSTQLTLDLIRTLIDPGDPVMVLDPTYANYEGQIGLAVPGSPLIRLPVVDPESWSYLPDTDPEQVLDRFHRLWDEHRPRLVLFSAPDNPTGQIVPDSLADAMRERSARDGAWLVVDFAYKCQTYRSPPKYFGWSPADHPHFVAVHSNSKWARGLGRRLGWIEAAPEVVEALERIQQCTILCPDSLSQMAMARYLERAIPDGSLREYVEEAREGYRRAAQVTVEAVEEHLGLRCLEPAGGLYTVMELGEDAEAFVPEALEATGVLVVPGAGFGPSLEQGVRISFGPHVRRPDRIREGMERLGRWMATARTGAPS